MTALLVSSNPRTRASCAPCPFDAVRRHRPQALRTTACHAGRLPWVAITYRCSLTCRDRCFSSSSRPGATTSTGYVVDYRTYPDQQRAYFTLRDARYTLAAATRTAALEGAIYAGLKNVTGKYLSRDWPRDDGALLRIERCLIDANWGNSTDVVYQFCRQSAHAGIVMPSHGRFVGASSQPFSEYKRRPGDRVGHNWRIPNVQGKRAVRHVVFDANYWKSFIYARLATPMGDHGCLSLFGDRPDQHRLLADHLTAEYRVKTQGRGRTVDEWKQRPERADNHWFDCLVGAAVAASIQGRRYLEPRSGRRRGADASASPNCSGVNAGERVSEAKGRPRHRLPSVRLPALLHHQYGTAPRRQHPPPQGLPPLRPQDRYA